MKRLSIRFLIALCLSVAATASTRAETAREPVVHLVSVGDSDTSKIGAKVGQDADNMAREFEKAFAEAGRARQLNSIVLKGEDVTAAKIMKTIADLPVEPNDAVVFLYSGHGAMTGQNVGMLTLHHDLRFLPRDEVLEALHAKKARLTVLLTDACSSYLDRRAATPSVDPKEPRSLPASKVMEWSTIENLFLAHSGTVDIQAAEPGYPAGVDHIVPGSYFTNAFLRILTTPHQDLVSVLDGDGDSALQWDEVLPQLRGMAAEFDRAQHPRGRSQQASAWSLGRWAPAAAK